MKGKSLPVPFSAALKVAATEIVASSDMCEKARRRSNQQLVLLVLLVLLSPKGTLSSFSLQTAAPSKRGESEKKLATQPHLPRSSDETKTNLSLEIRTQIR